MTIRDDTYIKFGPLLVEALVDTMLEEINTLRTNAGLPERPKEAFLGMSNNNQNHLERYNWMEEGS